MSGRIVHPIILAGIVSFTLWGWGNAQAQEAAPPPVNPPSSGNPFEDEGPKSEKAPPKGKPAAEKNEGEKPAAKEEGGEKSDKKPEGEKPAEEKKPEEEKVISEEVEPIVVPAPAAVKKEPAKPAPADPKLGDVQPTVKKPEVHEPVETKPALKKPVVIDEHPEGTTPPAKKPVEADKPVHHDEPEGAERPAPLAPHHKSGPKNEVEIERSVYRAGNGTFHLAGHVATAHYQDGDGKDCLAVLHLMGPSSPNPPFVLPESDANYLYYYQDAGCGDASVLAWAFQRPVSHSEGLWIMKYVRDAAGKKSWVVHGGAQRMVVGCLKKTGSDCQPAYDPPAAGESPRPNPPPAKKSPDDVPVSPSIRFDPLDADVERTPRDGGHIIFRAQ